MPAGPARQSRGARPRPDRGTAGGYVPELDQLVHDLAAATVGQLEQTRRAAGAPWRAAKLSDAQALAKMDEWDAPVPAPEVQRAAAALTKGEAAAAALDAVRRRSRALAHGTWQPAAPAPPPMAPAAPPMVPTDAGLPNPLGAAPPMAPVPPPVPVAPAPPDVPPPGGVYAPI